MSENVGVGAVKLLAGHELQYLRSSCARARAVHSHGSNLANAIKRQEQTGSLLEEIHDDERSVNQLAGTLEHIFSVDVEDYFHVHAFERTVERSTWDSMPSRVAYTTDIILDLLASRSMHGTFFVLGWVARKHPDLVRRIADGGHEVASHGCWHRKVSEMTEDEFRIDLRTSRNLLEDISGQEVIGFRAPSFSIRPGMEWAFDALLEEGYRYDSSLFPIRRLDYGYPSAPPIPHVIQRAAGSLVEFPLTTTMWGKFRLPAAGGGYFRHLPYALTRRAFRECCEAGIPGTFYIHPWEIDPHQPRLRSSPLTRIRHYSGLSSTFGRLEQLLSEFRFTTARSRLYRALQARNGGSHEPISKGRGDASKVRDLTSVRPA